jgi:ATP-binding cassette, subfamily B, bacterial
LRSPLRALEFFRTDDRRLVLVFLLMIAGVGMALLKPWPIAVVIDSLLGEEALPNWLSQHISAPKDKEVVLIVLVAATFAIHFSIALLTATYNRVAIGIGLAGLQQVRCRVFERLQNLSLRFYLGHQQGDLIQRAAWDTYAFQTVFQQGLINLVSASLTMVLMIAVMASLNGTLTLASLATIPFLLFAIRTFGKQMSRRSAAAQEADSQITSAVQQNISAVEVIRSFTRERLERDRFTASTKTARDQRYSQHSWEIGYLATLGIIFGGGIAVILWIGSRQVIAGTATVGELIVFLTYLTQFYEPLNQLSNVGSTVHTASAGVNRVYTLLDSETDIVSSKIAVRGAFTAVGGIEFEKVTFGYVSGKPIVSDLDLKITPGETIAIVGPSGAGKSTLLNLILRFFDAESGRVIFDGKSATDIHLDDLRSQIAYVPQKPILLPGSIEENIALGRPGASREEVEKAARAARAHEFIQHLPGGYTTAVGEGAQGLSVGEGQRICLARAFLKDAPILLLDEPTSALDAENEANVVESLIVLSQGKTTLLVTHHASVLSKVDRILVMKRGRISADGTPQNVSMRSEFFGRMMGSQRA